MSKPQSRAYRSMQSHLRCGFAVVFLVVGCMGGWAATCRISGAIIAQGRLVVDSHEKKVQPPVGGIVRELHVTQGQRVQAGDIVLRLDDTQARANLAIVTKELDELSARTAREIAERDGARAVSFPQTLLARSDEPEVARILAGERSLFETRRKDREGQKSQLTERIAENEQEIQGLTSQLSAKTKEIDWIHKELQGVNDLWKQNLVPFTRVTTLERDAARTEGESGNLVASVAQIKEKIAEIRLQILQIDQDMRTEVGKDLAESRSRTAALAERRIAAEDQLKHLDIRAPQTGFVHELDVHTVGGVVKSGETVMLIVPDADALSVEARIQPQDIDQVHVGQAATLRFSALNQRTTPEINGTVQFVAADVTQDQRSGASYYTVRITMPKSEIARLQDLALRPGMPVEVFMQTASRTMLAALVGPLTDQLARTFRQ